MARDGDDYDAGGEWWKMRQGRAGPEQDVNR